MSRTTRTRLVATSGVLVLAGLSLTACGNDDGSGSGSGEAGGLENVTISGDIGKTPEVEWKGQVAPDETETDVVTEGDGEELAAGDGALAHIWIGNGFTEDEAYNSYEAKAPQLLVGAISEPFKKALEGNVVGSRVAVAATAVEAFGEGGNPELGIGNKDGLVFVVDVLAKVGDEPVGAEREAAKWAPTVIEADGVVTGFGFAEANKPSKNLLDTTLIKGEGPVVESGQTIAVNYLGQVYNAKTPFDESYSAEKSQASFPIGVGQVVPGWDKALVGKTVGSRVILSIPPADGYGEAGNKDAGIKGTDTLFFVVDILAAA